MNPSRVRWGIFWILVGLVFLANNLGWLSWWVWADLLHLWPVLLIAIGLEMIVKRTKVQWAGYLSTLLIIFAFIWAIARNDGVYYHDSFSSLSQGTSEVTVDYNSGTSASINLSFEEGRLRFSDGRDYLFRAYSRHSRDEIILDQDCENNHCLLKLRPEEHDFSRWFGIRYDDNSWRCYVHPGVNSSYNLKLDDTNLRFDGREFLVDTLRLDADRSDLHIRLGDSRRLVYLNLDCYRSNVELFLPESVGVLIEGESVSGISREEFNLTESDGELVNPFYQRAKASFYIDCDIRHGRLRLRSY